MTRCASRHFIILLRRKCQRDKFAAAKNCVQLLRCMVEPPRLPSSVDFTMRYVSFLANVGLGAVG